MYAVMRPSQQSSTRRIGQDCVCTPLMTEVRIVSAKNAVYVHTVLTHIYNLNIYRFCRALSRSFKYCYRVEPCCCFCCTFHPHAVLSMSHGCRCRPLSVVYTHHSRMHISSTRSAVDVTRMQVQTPLSRLHTSQQKLVFIMLRACLS